MVTETQFLDQGFHPETQELSGWRTALNLGFLTGNPEIAMEIQIQTQVFWMETQILILISSPVFTIQLKTWCTLYDFCHHMAKAMILIKKSKYMIWTNCSIFYMSRFMLKCPVRSFSVKDCQEGPHQSLFWYDTSSLLGFIIFRPSYIRAT